MTAAKNLHHAAGRAVRVSPKGMRALLGCTSRNRPGWLSLVHITRFGGLGASDGSRLMMLGHDSQSGKWGAEKSWGRESFVAGVRPGDVKAAIKGLPGSDRVSLVADPNDASAPVQVVATSRAGASEVVAACKNYATDGHMVPPGLHHVVPGSKAKAIPVFGLDPALAADTFAAVAATGVTIVRVSNHGELDPYLILGDAPKEGLTVAGVLMPCRI